MPKTFPRTPKGRVSFASVFKATAMDDKQAKKYSVVLLFPKGADLLEMKKAAMDVAKEKWPQKMPSTSDPVKFWDEVKAKGKFKTPFRDGAEKDHLEGYEEGITFVRFSSKQKPRVVDAKRNDVEEEEFYSGCWAHLTYTCYSYSESGNQGVAFGLVNLQKVKDDEPFGGGSSDPEDDFEEVDEDDDEKPWE